MNKPILIFSDLFTTGGIQQYNRHMCDALEAEFSDSEIITLVLYEKTKNNIRAQRNIKLLFCSTSIPGVFRKVFGIYKILSAAFSHKPKFLICSHVNLAPIAYFLKKIINLKYAILTHGTDVFDLRAGIRYKALYKADLIITVSQYTKERMIKNGIPEFKITILPDTVDSTKFYKKSPDPQLANQFMLNGKKVLLTVGRITSKEQYKGHDTMLEVLQKLDEEYVWLVAGDGDDLPRLRRKAEYMSVATRVRFLGFIDDDKLVDYYNLCDIFIMPSGKEGFGIVFLEAMACGKPVIAGNKDGSSEPLMQGKLGFLVNPDNVEEIVKTIRLACTSRENRTDPEYLIKNVEQKFGINIFNSNVKTVFSGFFA